MQSLNYGVGADYIADKMHTLWEKDCVWKIDSALRGEGLLPDVNAAGEPSGEDSYALHYYVREKDIGNRSKSNYKLSSRGTKLHFSLRVRNIQSCAEHIVNCSNELKGVFIPGDKGCANRSECTHGQAYTIEGVEYWKCGCGGSMLTFQPRSEDIDDYLVLVKLGEKVK